MNLTEYHTGLCYAILLTDTKGDLTNSCILGDISKSQVESFAEKVFDYFW